ncbi:transcription factor NF-E2 45 kDa subunit isoform X1 [Alligator sinensis]|uniref:Transcription factor NF-E2 45 kDa subunit isoform X1 n=1 Tax=Alligator sinensis TaxID=38654 RepID=A0A3Q0FM85_ALLSI|nr:transcription factor NF-E2 45 kDa subunit isoform X1 [Alligator sinensis]XP_025047286.1 transcription factor NF-E2 45 kDa subunit isoform X1 [Alligator sinensis]XP_025047287.1 transcription factor NF-E2 45 kDa subunit isoform X1 [Alligator sinensis]XP_025047288.1 transcription factor NF-E2 45 kDa subunit isoform X1 [Alligator sinensis]XP_025047289.1 transcription factor NF-E2 45 kDa subunit isoform X1 [Alligator sinensis]
MRWDGSGRSFFHQSAGKMAQIFAATAGFGATLLEPPLGRAWPSKMPPCPPQQGRARAPLLSGPLGGEHGPPGDMDLAWQEILSIAELQGLDLPSESPYDPALYSLTHPLAPVGGYGPCPALGDAPGPSCGQPCPGYERPYMDAMLAPCARLGMGPLPAMDPSYGYTGMLISSAMDLPSKVLPGEAGALPELGLAPPPPCKAQEDLESDSGLSLNYSDADSGEPEGLELGQARPDYAELYPVDYGLPYPGLQGVPPFTPPCPPLPPPEKDRGTPRAELGGSRDERRALAMNIPIPTEKIINLPVEDFNELVSRHPLSEPQLALIRDIRRRGKNKVAAQNCRRRKLEGIAQLEHELERLDHERQRLLRDRREADQALGTLRRQLAQLYRQVFQRLRDEAGEAYSPEHYSLQLAADGTVLLVPRGCKADGPD